MVRANWDPKALDLMEDSFLSSPLFEEEEGDGIEIPDLEVQMMIITKIKIMQPQPQGVNPADLPVLERHQFTSTDIECLRALSAACKCRQRT